MKMLRGIWSIICLLFNILRTFPRDTVGFIYYLKIEFMIWYWGKRNYTVSSLFSRIVRRHPNKKCFMYEDIVWTYRQVEDYSNRIAYVFSKTFGLKKGDTVSLFMENRPEYICIWLGLSKIGVITALINTNLKSQPLVHSITVSKSKILIYGAELTNSVNEVRKPLEDSNILYLVQGAKEGDDTDPQLDLFLMPELIDLTYCKFDEENSIGSNDVLFYIFTSGTTGLPKPAIIKHSRYYAGAISFFTLAALNRWRDKVYVALPLYHANGVIIGCGPALIIGATVVIRKKFSVSSFWSDCKKYKCTAFIYVGEICRYLLNQPPSPQDRDHRIKVAIGNGLRLNIWSDFRKRFGVRPVEFYASSEGNCVIVNTHHYPGACGYVPILNRFVKILPLNIVKIDTNNKLVRDKNGFCIPCKPGEKGLALGIIGKSTKTAYAGYANNKSASESKIVENVFRNGQRAFDTGDLMMSDSRGWIYFCDRLGDTYRWKGENVSTFEVENVISSKINSHEVVVYGVEIPGLEGRAGMATIPKADVDVEKLALDLKDELPPYARPVFIRLTVAVEHTGSFKAKKSSLVEDGYDINKIKDLIFYFDTKQQTYLQLTEDILMSIQNRTFAA